jgi:hypothetical protein
MERERERAKLLVYKYGNGRYGCMCSQERTKEERKRSWEIRVAGEMALAAHIIYMARPSQSHPPVTRNSTISWLAQIRICIHYI